jgi:hypothetical protein
MVGSPFSPPAAYNRKENAHQRSGDLGVLEGEPRSCLEGTSGSDGYGKA